jgi:head-tail adaptor
MPAGQLREFLIFDKRDEAEDGHGNSEAGWREQFRCAARVVFSKSNAESVIAARLDGRQPVSITIGWSRAASKADTAWRIRDKRTQKIYDITSVAPDEKHQWIDIMAVERGAET